MPKGVDTFVEDGYATISVSDAKQRGQVLNEILKTTPPELIQTNTRTGPHRSYTIPEGNARDAGLIDGEGGERPVGDRHDSGNAAALVQAFKEELADDHHIVTPTVAEEAYGATSSRVLYGDEVDGEPKDSNQKVTGPLRPNKAVAESVPEPPAGASTTAAALQAKIKAATPRPAAYEPDYSVPVDDRAPSGTILPKEARVEAPTADNQEPDTGGNGFSDDPVEYPEGEPSNQWGRDELDAYALRHKKLDTSGLKNKGEVLKAIKGEKP